MKTGRILYPAWLDLRNTPVLVVGAGRVALRRTTALLEAEAAVRVVSPRRLPEFKSWITSGKVEWINREFQDSDVESARLALACTNDPEVNRSVVRAARSHGVWVSSCTVEEETDLYPAAFLRRGILGISVTSSAAAPILSRVLRDCLAEIFADDWSSAAEEIARGRGAGMDTVEARVRAEFRRSVARWLGSTP